MTIDPEMLATQIAAIEPKLKATPEGRSVLELCAHDVKMSGRSKVSTIEKIRTLKCNLATFITGEPIPSDGHSNVEQALWRSKAGAEILASASKSTFGLAAEIALVERMAAHVVAHGREQVGATQRQPPPAQLPPPVLTARPAVPQHISVKSELAFPDAAAAVARGGMVNLMTRQRATITKADLEAPKADASPCAFKRHYEALIASGDSMRAGKFWQRHRAKINEANEEP